MGRRAKYFTREDRLEARREQRRARGERPGAKEVRRLHNQRAWERLQLRPYTNAALPDEVQRWASSPWLFKEQTTVIQFRAGPRTLRFGNLEIGDREFHVLSFGHLQDALGIVNIPPNFEECWDELSAALYGYQIRVFKGEQISQLTLYGAQSKRQFSISLRRRHEELLARWEMLLELIPRLKQEGNRPAELISRHNARWTAEQVVFAYNDLQALVKGGGVYVSTLSERHRALGRLYC